MEQTVRCKKAIFSFYKTIYFSFATYWAYSLLKDEPFLSWTLGGKGDFANSFEDIEPGSHTIRVVEIDTSSGFNATTEFVIHVIEPLDDYFVTTPQNDTTI